MSEEKEDWSIEELDKIIEQGTTAHKELAADVSQKITDLSNISYKIGRYKQLRSMLADQDLLH